MTTTPGTNWDRIGNQGRCERFQALQIKPDDDNAWNNWGIALGNLGRRGSDRKPATTEKLNQTTTQPGTIEGWRCTTLEAI